MVGGVGGSIKHLWRGTRRDPAVELEPGREATNHVRVVSKSSGGGQLLPEDVQVPRAEGGGPKYYAWVRNYMDSTIS